MIAELPDSIRVKAEKCAHDFSCLETGCCGDQKMCQVMRSFGTDVLVLAAHEQSTCAYRISFGDGQLCTCPVRQYLHTLGRSGPN